VKVERLFPFPDQKTQFAWSHHVTVPERPGCYALVTYSGEVLYVGMAETSVRDRMGAHLEAREKRTSTTHGAAYWFYYITCEPKDVRPIERGWMNRAILEDGTRPILNKIDSPL
jgi:hypothetical protein